MGAISSSAMIFLCFDFSDLRQCGEHLRDPGLPDHVVGVGVFEDLSPASAFGEDRLIGPGVGRLRSLIAVRLAREGVEVIEERLPVPVNSDVPLIRFI